MEDFEMFEELTITYAYKDHPNEIKEASCRYWDNYQDLEKYAEDYNDESYFFDFVKGEPVLGDRGDFIVDTCSIPVS